MISLRFLVSFANRVMRGYHPARCCSRVLSVPDYSRPVHPNIADARRELVRILKRGPVHDGLGIEDYYVSVTASTQEPAVA